MQDIRFDPFNREYLPLFEKWVEKPYVRNTWFITGYEPKEYIISKINGNGYDYPFVIVLDKKPVGYIQYCDLYAYKTLCAKPTGSMKDEPKGTYCVDLFIGEEDYLNKGFGTGIVKSFINILLAKSEVKRILIDPSCKNTRAIRCYEKVGFKFLRETFDGVETCYVMELVK